MMTFRFEAKYTAMGVRNAHVVECKAISAEHAQGIVLNGISRLFPDASEVSVEPL